MDYRIEQKEKFEFFGIGKTFSLSGEKHYEDIPMFWREIIEDGRFENLRASAGTYENQELGQVNALCGYDHDDVGSEENKYMIGCFMQKDSLSEGYEVVEIPASKWAIFRTEVHEPSETTEQIQSLNKRIFTDWFLSSGYEYVSGYGLELYYFTPEGKTYCESWIRVK